MDYLEADHKSRAPTPAPEKRDPYVIALDELESANQDRGTWARAVAESGGSIDRARSIYLRLRSADLSEAESVEVGSQIATAFLWAVVALSGFVSVSGVFSLWYAPGQGAGMIAFSITLAIVAAFICVAVYRPAMRRFWSARTPATYWIIEALWMALLAKILGSMSPKPDFQVGVLLAALAWGSLSVVRYMKRPSLHGKSRPQL